MREVNGFMSVYAKAGKAFKGNLDPVADILQSSPEQCRQKAKDLICRARGKPYMLSAGCEIPAQTPDATFEAFCKAVID